jgi:hypothetical protein
VQALLTRLRIDARLLPVLLMALVLRLAVPAGYMLDPAGTSLALIPCPQVSIATEAAVHSEHEGGRHHGQPAPGEPATHSQSPCPYAALAAPVLPPAPALFVPPRQVVEAAALPSLAAAPAIAALAAPPPPSRGPPSV